MVNDDWLGFGLKTISDQRADKGLLIMVPLPLRRKAGSLSNTLLVFQPMEC